MPRKKRVVEEVVVEEVVVEEVTRGGKRQGSGRKQTPSVDSSITGDDGTIGMSPDKVPEPPRYHCNDCDGVLSLRDLKCASCGTVLDWSGVA